MTPLGHAEHNAVREFVRDHPEFDGPQQGVLGILKNLQVLGAFLEWCVRKGYCAPGPGDAAIIAVNHLAWAADQDAILARWQAERPEIAGVEYPPGSPEAIEQMIAFCRWKVGVGLTAPQTATRMIASLEQHLQERRGERDR
jgi:hypothetical protein